MGLEGPHSLWVLTPRWNHRLETQQPRQQQKRFEQETRKKNSWNWSTEKVIFQHNYARLQTIFDFKSKFEKFWWGSVQCLKSSNFHPFRSLQNLFCSVRLTSRMSFFFSISLSYFEYNYVKKNSKRIKVKRTVSINEGNA